MTQNYFIREGYVSRERPDYFVDIEAETGLICQPDMYPTAGFIAETLGSKRIVDIGCGNGFKLASLYPELEIIGVDFGENLETCRERYPFGTWLHHDLDTEDPLPLTEEQLTGAVIVAADVIEHLVRPELLLRKLKLAMEHADAILLSTPERELTWGKDHDGPPPNPHHVREWNIEEFGAFLESEGFEFGDVGLTLNNNVHRQLNNIFATLLPSEHHLDLLANAAARRDQRLAG
jgi:SAM-dependent methyltransferase